MTDMQSKIDRLMRQASEMVGFEVTADNYRGISPEQAKALLARLRTDPEFGELALTRGTAIAEANVWLCARQSGVDLPLEDVGRMAQGLAPRVEVDDSEGDVAEPPAHDPAAARARLTTLGRDPAWREKALTHGTLEARENLELNAAASGVKYSATDLDRMARGLGPQAGAVTDSAQA
jgi:hypothetical protein